MQFIASSLFDDPKNNQNEAFDIDSSKDAPFISIYPKQIAFILFFHPSIHFLNIITKAFLISIIKLACQKYFLSMQKGRSVNDFQVVARLGQGAFGQVFKVKRKQTGEIYAMKKIKTITMKQKDRQNALNQIRILASTVGDHIIGYKDSFYDQQSQMLCIILQFAGKGDIMKKIAEYQKKKKFIQQPQIWKAMVQIAKGIKSLHDINILHRDLKSANIFITDDGTYKLGDLNISKVLKQGLAHTQTGTPYYCSPEVWQDKPYGSKSDMWSFGCVLYEMAAQKPPFTATDIQGLCRKICAGVFPRIPNHYSSQLSEIINSCLKLNPSLRPSTQDILKNPIVQKNFGGEIQVQVASQKPNLLRTIQFEKRGWKQMNNNLPKANYDDTCDQEAEKNFDNQLQVPIVRVNNGRPLSTASDKKYIQNRSEVRNRSNQKQYTEQEYQAPNRRQRVMSAYKNPGQNIDTPTKGNNKNLVLPPIDPRQRRGSDNYDPRLMPPKPAERRDGSRSSRNSSNDKNGRVNSRQRLQKAGQQAVNYKVPYGGY